MLHKEIFHIAYHMKQPVSEVMSWPHRLRASMLARLNKQHEFEERQLNKK